MPAYGSYGCPCSGGPTAGTSSFGRLGSFGQTEGSSSTDWFEQFLPAAAATYQETLDPVRQVAILRAELANAYERGAKLSEIRVLEGKLAAAEEKLASAQRTEASRWEWTNLSKVGLLVGIGLGLAGIYRLTS